MSDLVAFGITYRCICGNSFHRTKKVDPEKVMDLVVVCGKCWSTVFPKEWTELEQENSHD